MENTIGPRDEDVPASTQSDSITWWHEGNRCTATINGQKVVASLQQRPDGTGAWVDRWVWESDHMICDGSWPDTEVGLDACLTDASRALED